MNSDHLDRLGGAVKAVFDNAAVAITLADEQERLILWNRCAENLIGLDPGQLYLKPVRELYPASEWQRLRSENIREKGIEYQTETQIINSSNKIVPVDLSISILKSPDGCHLGSIGVLRDISKRKKTENNLKANDGLNSGILEDSPNPVMATNTDSSIKYVNQAFEELTGFTRNEVLGLKPPYPWWPAELAESFLKANVGGRQMNLNRLERRYQKKNGEAFWISTSIKAVKEKENVKYYLANWLEITERKQAEEALKESEAKFRNLVENAPLGISVTSFDGKILSLNKAMADIFDFDSQAEMMSEGMLNRYVDPADRKGLLEQMIQAERVKDFEVQMKRKGGQVIWCSLCAIPQVTKDGERLVIGIIEDITQRKEMEEIVRKAKDAAEEATRAKSDFLAHMSHEIRTPMNAITGLSHLCLKTELDPKQKDYLSKIQSSANALMGIINDILDLSKVEAGKIELEIADFRLDQLFDNLANVFLTKVQEKGLTLSFKIGPDVPLVLRGDALRLGQILMNLVSNAVKFTHRGEIAVSGELVGQRDENLRLRISVSDTGIGLSTEQIDRLFQPFMQADSSTTRKYGGTGLGLVISKKLANLMGGDITVCSNPGAGSVFTLNITTRAGTVNRQDKNKILPSSLRGLRVMVADDDAAARQIISQMLSEMSFEVKAVNSGQAVLKELDNQDPGYDLVLLDWRMPDMDGFETARRIRSKIDLPKVPKIFIITSYGREDVLQQTKKLGLDAFLVKPISYSILLDNIMETFCQGQPHHLETEEQPRENFSLSGRLLVVEDNEINQQVAQELLQGMGLAVEIACNGKEALQILGSNGDRFDAVLMDLQMPEMDGYQATELMRQKWSKEKLPIIAMTAHALQTELRNCLDAGMNDYVTKPIDPEKLRSTLLRWIKPRTSASAAVPPAPFASLNGVEAIPGIDLAEALNRLMGNRALFDKLLYQFVVNNTDVVERIRVELERGGKVSAKNLVHGLKGVAGNLSAIEVFKVAQNLEASLREDDRQATDMNLAKLEAALLPIMRAIMDKSSKARELPSGMVIQTPNSNGSDSDRLVVEMDMLLKRNSLNARRSFDTFKQRLAALGLERELAKMEICLDRLDFKSARQELALISRILGVELIP